MIPIVRTEQILVQEVGDQVIIYDRENHTSHCLNRTAARVWHYCNGHNTVEDIAKLLEKELELSPTQTSELCVAKGDVTLEELVWQALEEFERNQLLKEYVPTGAASLSRRKAIKTVAIGGGVALGALFPAIKSIVVPTPAMATSNLGGGKGGKGGKGGDERWRWWWRRRWRRRWRWWLRNK